MPIRVWIFAVCLAVAAALFRPLQAAAPEAHPQPVAAGDQSAAWLDCQFGPLPGGDQARVLIMTLGDRVERAVVVPLGLAATDASGLEFRSNRIVGKLMVGHEPLRMNRTLVPRNDTRMPLEFELVVEKDRVRGTFKGFWPKPKSIDQRVPVEGRVMGVYRNADRLQQENGLPAEGAWPSWLGPNQNFSSGPCRQPLVGNLQQARLVWVSQWIGPTESGSQRYGGCVGSLPCAGGASPLVWNGRVYQFRYEASGEAYQQAHVEKILTGERAEKTRSQMAAIGWTEADLKHRWSVLADEQLVCIDAATGKTLWKVTWPGEGLNLYDHKCSLTNHTGVIAGGKVYVLGALGIVRCVDAQTGNVHWAAQVPGYSDFMQKFKAKCLETRNVWAPTRSFCHGLNIAGNVVLAPDGIGACGIVGLDAGTGQVLWRVEKVLGKCATPMTWQQGGREYVVAANESGRITCIEPETGKLLWRYDKAGDNEYQTLLVGDLLVGHKLKKDAREKAPRTEDSGPHSAPGDNYGQVAGWQISPEGIKEVWQAPATWGAPKFSPVGSTAGGLICFRGNFSYYLVKPQTGERVSSHHLPTPVRWDEGHMLALPEAFVLHPDSQHGHTKMFLLPARDGAELSPMWSPPHPHATTYQSAMSHAWVDGRLFIRGADALYCYDLRKRSTDSGE